MYLACYVKCKVCSLCIQYPSFTKETVDAGLSSLVLLLYVYTSFHSRNRLSFVGFTFKLPNVEHALSSKIHTYWSIYTNTPASISLPFPLISLFFFIRASALAILVRDKERTLSLQHQFCCCWWWCSSSISGVRKCAYSLRRLQIENCTSVQRQCTAKWDTYIYLKRQIGGSRK